MASLSGFCGKRLGTNLYFWGLRSQNWQQEQTNLTLLRAADAAFSDMFKFIRSRTKVDLSDEALLQEYTLDKRSEALGQLYERYIPMVYGVCLNILKDPGKSEDAVMGIYESLARKVADHQIENFRAWLYVFARNHCLMEWRKMKRRPTDLHPPEDMYKYEAVEQAFEVELPQKTKPLEKCMGELPDLQRQTVQLFYYEEKSYKDISDMISEDVGKVRSYIQNGRRNLKICLEKSGVSLNM